MTLGSFRMAFCRTHVGREQSSAISAPMSATGHKQLSSASECTFAQGQKGPSSAALRMALWARSRIKFVITLGGADRSGPPAEGHALIFRTLDVPKGDGNVLTWLRPPFLAS